MRPSSQPSCFPSYRCNHEHLQTWRWPCYVYLPEPVDWDRWEAVPRYPFPCNAPGSPSSVFCWWYLQIPKPDLDDPFHSQPRARYWHSWNVLYPRAWQSWHHRPPWPVWMHTHGQSRPSDCGFPVPWDPGYQRHPYPSWASGARLPQPCSGSWHGDGYPVLRYCWQCCPEHFRDNYAYPRYVRRVVRFQGQRKFGMKGLLKGSHPRCQRYLSFCSSPRQHRLYPPYGWLWGHTRPSLFQSRSVHPPLAKIECPHRHDQYWELHPF